MRFVLLGEFVVCFLEKGINIIYIYIYFIGKEKKEKKIERFLFFLSFFLFNILMLEMDKFSTKVVWYFEVKMSTANGFHCLANLGNI